MTQSSQPAGSLACPACGQRVGVSPDMAGRLGRCPRCSGVFRVTQREGGTLEAVSGAAPLAQAPPPELPRPQHVSFNCELCETRMTFSTAHVGRKVRCPDCGRVNRVPQPAPPKAPVTPAAMEGEQYELWGVDEAPLPAELQARQQPLIATPCELCGTLMYGRHDQVGQTLTCPDCGASTTVRAQTHQPPRGPQPVASGDEYELDEASAPPPRPVPKIVAIAEAERHEAARIKHNEPRRGSRGKDASGKSSDHVYGYPDERESAPLPHLWRAARMLLTEAVVVRWIALSAGLTAVAWLVTRVDFSTAGMVGAMAGAMMSVCLIAGAVIFGTLWFVAASAAWLAIVTESSEGNDRLNHLSYFFLDWLGDAAFMVIAAATSAIPAALTAKAAALTGIVAPILAGVAWLACFPVAILSALEQGSPMGVVNPRIWATLFLRPIPWLAFYLQVAIALGGIVAALASLPTAALLYVAPAAGVLATLLYCRMIGLLGWRLGETRMRSEDDERKPD